MYGVQLDHELDSLIPMPNDGDTWSVMQSWIMPTRSFLEFVMFSRYGLCFWILLIKDVCTCLYKYNGLCISNYLLWHQDVAHLDIFMSVLVPIQRI